MPHSYFGALGGAMEINRDLRYYLDNVLIETGDIYLRELNHNDNDRIGKKHKSPAECYCATRPPNVVRLIPHLGIN